MFELSNYIKGSTGELWFVIPKSLQGKIVPYLTSKLDGVTNETTKKYYHRDVIGRALGTGAADDYGYDAHMFMSGIMGYFSIYECCGEWHIGTVGEGGIRYTMRETVKRAFIAELENFSE